MKRTFASLQFRNFRLFFTGQLVSQIGSWMRQIAMALLVLKLTDNGVALGGLVAFQFLPVLVMGPWAGLLADRSDKRKLLLIVQSCLMANSFVIAALAAMGPARVWSLSLVALVGGVFTALDTPARRSFVTEMVPEDKVQN